MIPYVTRFFTYAGILAIPLAEAFPKLTPAFDLTMEVGNVTRIGSLSRGTTLNDGALIGGTMKSVPGYQPVLDLVWFGSHNDYFREDVDGKHQRLNAAGVLRSRNNTNEFVYFSYTGITNVPEGGGVNTEFGNVFNQMTFETGTEKYRALENTLFVGSGRVVVGEGDDLTVEYQVSQVGAK